MSDDWKLTSQQHGLIKELAKRVLLKAKLGKSMSSPDAPVGSITAVSTKAFAERVDSVPWGGVSQDVTKWWPRKDKSQDKVSTQSEGARLLAGYLKIMKWPKVSWTCLLSLILYECKLTICLMRRIFMSSSLLNSVLQGVSRKWQYCTHWNGVRSIVHGKAI